jgi:formiminotetrahydrofolate cyclodeaminase
MKLYKKNFNEYLDELGKKTPHPGGGSGAALVFCLGVSLIQMSIAYSIPRPFRINKTLRLMRKKIFPFIDRDGQVFAKVVKSKNKSEKRKWLGSAQKLTFEVGEYCHKLFLVARSVRGKIKSSIESDFYIGLKLAESALYSSIKNLEANQRMFQVDNTKKISRLKRYLKQYQQWLPY